MTHTASITVTWDAKYIYFISAHVAQLYTEDFHCGRLREEEIVLSVFGYLRYGFPVI